MDGKFPIIDFLNLENAVSLKTLHIYKKSYKTDGNIDFDKISNRINEYYNAMDDIEITLNGNRVHKILDVEINKNKHAQSLVEDVKSNAQNKTKCSSKFTSLFIR